jgi:hypothetical protein
MPQFTLGPTGSPTNVATPVPGPSGGRPPVVSSTDLGSTGIPDSDPDVGGQDQPEPFRVNGGHSTRHFDRTYSESPSVQGPMGLMNVGYVHNVISTNGQWGRGELPDLGYGYAFALRRPKFMREPRTDLGSYNLAQG